MVMSQAVNKRFTKSFGNFADPRVSTFNGQVPVMFLNDPSREALNGQKSVTNGSPPPSKVNKGKLYGDFVSRMAEQQVPSVVSSDLAKQTLYNLQFNNFIENHRNSSNMNQTGFNSTNMSLLR